MNQEGDRDILGSQFGQELALEPGTLEVVAAEPSIPCVPLSCVLYKRKNLLQDNYGRAQIWAPQPWLLFCPLCFR